MKKYGAVVVGSFATLALLAPAGGAMAVDQVPQATSGKVKFVPKSATRYTGPDCGPNSVQYRGAVIALTGGNARQLSKKWNTEMTVKTPGKPWSAPKRAAGPSIGMLGWPALPSGTYHTITAKKAGTYKVKLRTAQDRSRPIVNGDDEGFVAVGPSPWTKVSKVKVKKSDLKKVRRDTSKGYCSL